MQDAFAQTLVVLWQVLIGIGGLGFLLSLGLQNLPLTWETDEENFGIEEKVKDRSSSGSEEEKVGDQ